jgi:DNA-binding beta-propeller fold protein YncE
MGGCATNAVDPEFAPFDANVVTYDASAMTASPVADTDASPTSPPNSDAAAAASNDAAAPVLDAGLGADSGAKKGDGGASSAEAATGDAGTRDATTGDASTSDATAPDATAPDASGAPDPLRDVLLVGNSLSGSVSFIDVDTFENLGSVNVIPDFEEVMNDITFSLVGRQVAYGIVKGQQLIHHFEPGNGDRFVDDIFVSPDGKVLYVSRSNLGDVAAFDLSKPMQPRLWRSFVVGYKADHAAISPDGARLVVSDTTQRTGDVFNAKTGEMIGRFPTGYYPHQNDYSADGKFIYNSSIGNVGYNAVSYADNASAGERWLVKVDAATLQVVRTWNFEFGIRPSVITPDDKIMYANLSYLNGVIKYDLEAGKEIARSEQPLNEFAMKTYKTYDEFPHDSAHHGLSLSGDGKKLCDCGTVDNYVAIVTTSDMKVEKYVDVGPVPYWATTSPNGKRCFVSISGDNTVSVIDFEQPAQLKVVPVGKFPQRSRLGRVPESVLRMLSPADG